MVSKAALRSRGMRIVSKSESTARRRSFVILISADSVLWTGQKPDCNCLYWLLRVR